MRICITVFQHSLSCMQKLCLNAHLQNTVPFYFRSSQFYISSIKSLSFLYPLTLNYTCTYNSETLNKKKIPLKLESHLSLFINYTFYWSYYGYTNSIVDKHYDGILSVKAQQIEDSNFQIPIYILTINSNL